MPPKQKSTYQEIIDGILKPLSKKHLAQVAKIVDACKKKNLTKDGKNRKLRVVDRLFMTREETLALIYMYMSILPMFKAFILMSEQKMPLHEEQKELLTHLCACLVKEEKLSGIRPKQLISLDFSCKENFKNLNDMFVGEKVKAVLNKKTRIPNKQFTQSFLLKVQKAYIQATKYLAQKLPLTNSLLRRIAAIDPVAIAAGHSVTASSLNKLKQNFPQIIQTSDDHDTYTQEVSKIILDPCLPDPYTSDGKPVRLDHWWNNVPNIRPCYQSKYEYHNISSCRAAL